VDNQSPRRYRRRNAKGFTILELVVSAAIFLIVTGAVYSLLRVGTSNRFTANQRIESIQNVRIALNQIGRECLNAAVDYYPTGALVPDDTIQNIVAFPADGDSAPDYFLPILPRNDVDTNSLSGALTDRVTIVYGDDSFNFRFPGADNALNTADDILSSYIPIDQITSGTNFRVYNTTATPFTNAACSVGALYLVTETGTSPRQTIGMCTALSGTNTVVFGADVNNINQPSSATGVLKALSVSAGTPGRLTPLVLVTYYVAPNGTLFRRLYGDYSATGNPTAGTGVTASTNTWLDEPLAFGIADFQLQYLLEDGSVTSSPPLSMCTGIRQIQVSITAQGTEPDPLTRRPYETRLVASFNTRNLAYSIR
jgi:prepilin-type N-terminal cleavage/methylation domain-containing protein